MKGRAFVATLVVAVVSSLVTAAPAWSQANRADEDRLVLGTWTLNLDKSKYATGRPPRQQTRVYEAAGDSLKATIETVHANGKTTRVQFVASYDSLDHPVTGSTDADTIRLKKTAPNTAEATLSHAGKVSGVAKRVISSDGMRLTITYDGETQGDQVHYVAVYDKKRS